MRTKKSSQFSIENLLSQSTKKLLRATFLCFTIFDKKKLFYHNTEEHRRGNLLCFTKFLV